MKAPTKIMYAAVAYHPNYYSLNDSLNDTGGAFYISKGKRTKAQKKQFNKKKGGKK